MSFDAKAGQELLYGLIAANELDAIQISHGYGEADCDYAYKFVTRTPSINARRIVNTPGKHDGLAWQTSDGTWKRPIREIIVRAIQPAAGKQCVHQRRPNVSGTTRVLIVE